MADRYLNSLLGEHETILLENRQHWFVFVRTILVETLTILVLAAVITALWVFWAQAMNYQWLLFGYFLLIIPIVGFIFDFFQWYNRKFIITDFRVIQISGIINKDVIDSALEKVNDVKLTQSFFGRIFNYGTVEIMTASEVGINEIKALGSPIQFKTTMIDAKEKLEHSDRFGSQFRGGAVSKVPTDIPSMIQQLDNLRAQGLLTPEEFQAKKAELLKRL
jgi:uncharacterized membrane protein YdbT with pleckstrin-like domain